MYIRVLLSGGVEKACKLRPFSSRIPTPPEMTLERHSELAKPHRFAHSQ